MKVRSVLVCALLSWCSAHGLDISGFTRSSGVAVADARICFSDDSTTCAFSRNDGGFRFVAHAAGAGVQRRESTLRTRLVVSRNRVFAVAAASTEIDILLCDVRGRTAYAAHGRTGSPAAAVLLRSPLLAAGTYVVRLSVNGQSITRRIPVTGAPVSSVAIAAPVRPGMHKSSAVPSLTVSRRGYLTRTYQPAAETETGVAIELLAITDTGTAGSGDFHGLDIFAHGYPRFY